MTFKIIKNYSLKKLTTFKVGGKASFFARVKDEKDLLEVIAFAKSKRLPIFIIGGGSDILVSDTDFNGVVIKHVGKKTDFKSNKDGSVTVTAETGLTWDDLVKESVLRKLQGIECLSGIPGSVGAAPIQNIGAYGQELKDVFLNLTAYDLRSNRLLQLNKADCEFSYRESVFKRLENKGRFIITSVSLILNNNKRPTLTYLSLQNYLADKKIENPTLAQVRDAVLKLRGQKLDDPKLIGNAGSFFKNPIINLGLLEKIKSKFPEIPSYGTQNGEAKLFAGWLIEKTGWKGRAYMNAAVSDKNALVITNPKGRATAKEIMELANLISGDVYKTFGVKLEPEVQFIDFK